MSVLKYQSDDELVRVMAEWVGNFFPPNVVKNERNVTLIGDCCVAKSGIVSIIGLTEAAHELADMGQLELTPAPKVLTPAEQAAIHQAKELKRIQKEQLENSEAAFFERAKAAETAKNVEKEAKRQADTKEALNSEIMSFECYKGPNARDWSTIETVISELKRIVARVQGKQDFVRTLALVKQVKSELPDAPKLGDVDRIVRRISEQQQAARENPVDRKTLEASSWANRPR
jgi:hypothetical protein